MIAPPNERRVSVTGSTRVHEGFVRLDLVRVRIEREGHEPIEFERTVHDHGHAVGVLPIDAERRTAVVVRQLRVPILMTDDPDPFLIEACAGIIDPEDPDPETACRREGEEELGIRVREMESIGRVYLCPGTVTEAITLYLASYTGADRVSDGGGIDEDEDIDVIEVPLAELDRALAGGKIRDAKLMMLLQALKLSKPDLFAG